MCVCMCVVHVTSKKQIERVCISTADCCITVVCKTTRWIQCIFLEFQLYWKVSEGGGDDFYTEGNIQSRSMSFGDKSQNFQTSYVFVVDCIRFPSQTSVCHTSNLLCLLEWKDLEAIGSLFGIKLFAPYFPYSYSKINSRWIKGLNVRNQIL